MHACRLFSLKMQAEKNEVNREETAADDAALLLCNLPRIKSNDSGEP